jgi:hypothetical protein
VSTSRQGRTSGSASALLRSPEGVRRWLAENDRGRLLFLVLLTLGAAALMIEYSGRFTAASLFIPLLLGDMWLSPRRVPPFGAFLVVVLALTTWVEYWLVLDEPEPVPSRRWVTLGLLLVGVAIVVAVATRRNRLGVGGLTGDAILLDLQTQISRQGVLPPLPDGWYADVATRSAGGTSFAGDFMVTHLSDSGDELSVVLVDVSGKGVDAGTRSLVLSGAFSALLSAAPAERFLSSANDFLLQQGWDEGFATAVHLRLDTRTGDYVLRSAGHPPAIQFLAGSGRWEVLEHAEGPILGLSAAATFRPQVGRLGRNDAFLLYTDGLVERPRRDIGLGIDRLLGEAERRLRVGFAGTAQVLVDRLGASNDDCALVVLERL